MDAFNTNPAKYIDTVVRRISYAAQMSFCAIVTRSSESAFFEMSKSRMSVIHLIMKCVYRSLPGGWLALRTVQTGRHDLEVTNSISRFDYAVVALAKSSLKNELVFLEFRR